MKRAAILFSLIFCCGWLVAVQANDKTDLPVDRDFLVRAANCNHTVIEFSKVASKRAEATAVKDFATMLVKEHQEAYERLAKLLNHHKMGVVATLDKESREEMNRLNGLERADFDRAYLRWLVQEHRKAIDVCENQIKNGREEDIRSHARETLAAVKKHLKQAETLQSGGK